MTTDLIRTKPNTDLSTISAIQDSYTNAVKPFVTWCTETGNGITEESVKAYFVDLNSSDLAANTILVRRAAVKKRCRQLMIDAPIDEQMKLDRVFANLDAYGPARSPKVNDTSIHSDKILSYSELERLTAAATQPIALCIRFLSATGCRISEAMQIKIGHVEKGAERVKIKVVGKYNKSRNIILPTALYDAVRGHFRGEMYLFETKGGKALQATYVSGQIAKLGRKVLDRKISAHTLRHTFSTLMLRRGCMIDALSRYLGHSSVSITLDLYAHNELSDDELFEFISELV